mmetsp:Transcript_10606/g.20436  ORF Transcript_10606/g.20436 Transcript_10606/m.20436 type:complete len:248 (+) Transcript_10606:599-1342(+)
MLLQYQTLVFAHCNLSRGTIFGGVLCNECRASHRHVLGCVIRSIWNRLARSLGSNAACLLCSTSTFSCLYGKSTNSWVTDGWGDLIAAKFVRLVVHTHGILHSLCALSTTAIGISALYCICPIVNTLASLSNGVGCYILDHCTHFVSTRFDPDGFLCRYRIDATVTGVLRSYESGGRYDCSCRRRSPCDFVPCVASLVVGFQCGRGKFYLLSVLGFSNICSQCWASICHGLAATGQSVAFDGKGRWN